MAAINREELVHSRETYVWANRNRCTIAQGQFSVQEGNGVLSPTQIPQRNWYLPNGQLNSLGSTNDAKITIMYMNNNNIIHSMIIAKDL
jgi:hypothetical protein